MFPFERLEVWKKNVAFAEAILKFVRLNSLLKNSGSVIANGVKQSRF